MDQTTNVETGLFAELRKLSPKVTGGLLRMRQEAYRDATVPPSTNDSPPWRFQSRFDANPVFGPTSRWRMPRGISQDELIEFLEVAMTMQGCLGEEWALKAYTVYKECISGDKLATEATCCTH